MLRHARPLVALSALSLCVLCGGCAGAIIQPGHRGLLFDPKEGDIQHEILGPGYYPLSGSARIEDFDVTYSTGREKIRALSADGATMNLEVDVVYRPIVAELYELEAEIGRNYYAKVVSPALRSVALDVFAHHPCGDLHGKSMPIEDEIEKLLRDGTKGMHVEISSVDIANIDLGAKCLAITPPTCTGA